MSNQQSASSTKNSRQPGRKRFNDSLSTIVYGKMAPSARDLEEAVLGAIMLDAGTMDIATEILQPENFYVEAHQIIFRAMSVLHREHHAIDILTVVEKLKTQGELENIGGPYYVTKLTNAVVSSANLEPHARIIMQKFLARELIRLGGNMIEGGYEDTQDIFDLLEQAETGLFNVSLNYLSKDYRRIDAGMVKVVKRIEELRHQEESLTGITSGFYELDRVTHGWQNTDLIILAARPSVGKTAYALNLARNAALAEKPTPVGIFSLEMSESQLIERMISAESEIWLEKIKNGKLDDEQMKNLYRDGIHVINNAPIFIDDTAGLNMFQLRSKARRMKKKHGVGLIIIDYLQLMTGDSNKSDNREREISKISRELKKLGKDLEIPIIALSQLSREVEKRGKGQKMPQLSDLRESGAIEQDADMVMFLYRPPEEEVKEDGDLKNKALLRIAKNRHGSLDEIVFKFYGHIQKFMDMGRAELYEEKTGTVWKPVQLPTGRVPLNYSEPARENLPGPEEDPELPF